MNVVEVNHMTKDYGNGKGIFDISFSIEKGEVLGFLGPNGAGKTTTIRQLMGFSYPDSGNCSIKGMSCKTQIEKIQPCLGYLPGEIAFMDDMTGVQFLRFIADMKGLKDFARMEELIKKLELNPSGKIKKMSKGMKQKIGIVCAFMQRPEILILDEPTSGLDPLMQNIFVELVLEEKKRGTTILMSSHMFEEVEKTCDRVAIIKAGHLVAVDTIQRLKQTKRKVYNITFKTSKIAEEFIKENFTVESRKENQVAVSIQGDIMPLLLAISQYQVLDLDIKSQTLEELFLHFYGGNDNDK